MISQATAPVPRTAFVLALVSNCLWINLSEVVRYFAVVMPMMRDALPQVTDVAPMNLPVFLIWGAWDLVLVVVSTGICWLLLERFGATRRNAVLAGTFVWTAVFVILWLGLFNMNLASGPILAWALPLAWLEMVVAALIVRWAMLRNG